MAFQENDDLLEDVLRGRAAAQPDSEVLKSLVSNYQAKPMASALKQRIWQNAQAKNSKGLKPSFNWGLVAGLGLMIGFILLSSMSLGEMGFSAVQDDETTEVVLNSPALFSDVPVISPAFGFEYGGYVQAENLQSVGTMLHNANMKWTAIYVFQDQSLLSSVREQIETAHLNGLKILISVSGPRGVTNFDIENYASNYAAFVGQVAEAGADAIEIWPEANLNRDMPRELLGASNFAIILAEASAAIRVSNPDTLIVSGAPAPTGAEAAYPEQVINDDNFLQQLMDSGALDKVDCLGLHYNEGIVPPLSTSGDSRDDYYTRYLPTMLQRYRQIVEARIPICVTSIGYFSTEGLENVPDYFQWGANTSREEQLQWLSDAMEWLSLQTDVKMALIWNIDYVTDDEAIDQGFSIVFLHRD